MVAVHANADVGEVHHGPFFKMSNAFKSVETFLNSASLPISTSELLLQFAS